MALGRDDIWAFVIAGATSGLAAGGLAIAVRFTERPADLLSFIGGMIGAGAAVYGAIWVESSKRATHRHEARTQLGMAAGAVISAVQTTRELPVIEMQYGIAVIKDALVALDRLRQIFPVDDAVLAHRFASIDAWRVGWNEKLGSRSTGVIASRELRDGLDNIEDGLFYLLEGDEHWPPAVRDLRDEYRGRRKPRTGPAVANGGHSG